MPAERLGPCLFCPSCNRRLWSLTWQVASTRARAWAESLHALDVYHTLDLADAHAVQVRVALARARPSPLQSFTLESPAFAVGGLPDRFRPPDNFSRPHQKHPSAAAPADPVSKI